MLAQGTCRTTSLEIMDDTKTVLAFRPFWCNHYGPKAGKFGDPCCTTSWFGILDRNWNATLVALDFIKKIAICWLNHRNLTTIYK